MPRFFSPPTIDDVPRILPETRGPARLLMRHYSNLARGRSVILVGGHYTTVDNPSNDLLIGEEGIGWFLGGHQYVVDDDIAFALASDGYSLQGGATWGSFADDTWGSLPGTFWAGL